MIKLIKLISALVILFAISSRANAQNLYIKTFGKTDSQPVIFLHGGPGYNCASFEATTAQPLADSGFFVIVYDRRGEGRSIDNQAKFTFQETFADLDAIYQKYNITSATLIGHSFGGMVATLYAQVQPAKVQSLILVGAPVSLQASFRNIIDRSAAIYKSKNDSFNLKYIDMFQKMDTASLEYAVYSFGHAMQNHFYNPKQPNADAQEIYKKFKTDTILAKYAAKMTQEPTKGFWKNEHYTTLDLSETIKKLKQQNANIYGIYGKEDGLYSSEQIFLLQNILGANKLKYLDNCAHSVFVDQQTEFIVSIKKWIKI